MAKPFLFTLQRHIKMLKLLLAQTSRPAFGAVVRYFLEFAEEVNADVTVLEKNSGKKDACQSAVSGSPWKGWFFGDWLKQVALRRKAIQETVESSRLFSYDLIVTNWENKGKWLRPASCHQLARTAWSPVMLIPEQAAFRPIENILFLEDQYHKSVQPVLRKLSAFWDQQHFLYPRRRGSQIYRYQVCRFDETGYPVMPKLDANCLHEYIQRNNIDLIVAGQPARADSRALEKLTTPVLFFNPRNKVLPQKRNRAFKVSLLPKTSWVKEHFKS